MTVSFFYPLQPARQIHGRILRNPSRACRASRPFVDPFCPDRTRMVYSPPALIILSFVALSMPPCRRRPAEPWYRRKISTWNVSPALSATSKSLTSDGETYALPVATSEQWLYRQSVPSTSNLTELPPSTFPHWLVL